MASTTMIQMDHWTNAQAALSDSERTSINTLTNWLTSDLSSSIRKGEANGSNSIDLPSRPTTASSIRVAVPSLPSAPLTDAPSYLSWFSKQQTHISSSTQNSHIQALQSLSQAADRANVLLDHLEAARVHISELRAGARFVEEGSEGLREEAETMVERIDHLSQLSQALALRLSYFAILPASTSFLSSPSLSLVTSTDFLFTLDRLDVALAFVDAHPHYRDSPLYKMRFEHCVLRAGTLIRMYTLAKWKDLVYEVGTKLRAWEKNRETKGKEKESEMKNETIMYLAEPAVSSLIWDRFEEEAPSLRPLLAELGKRASLLAAPASTDVEIYGSNNNVPTDERSLLADYSKEEDKKEKNTSTSNNVGIFRSPEFVTLLSECRVAYFEARRSLLGGIISNCLAQIEASTASEANVPTSRIRQAFSPLVSFIRRSLTFLSAVCEKEVSLYNSFFVLDQESTSSSYKDVPNFIQSLCALLDDRIRSRMAKETGLSSIAAACLALIGDNQLEEDSSKIVYSNLSIAMLKEAQDRLSTKARQDLSGPQFAQFSPKEEDLNYPAKIRKSQSHRRAQSSIGGAGLLEAALDIETSSHRGFIQADATDSPAVTTSSVRLFTSPAKTIVSSWYPPLASTLSLLSTTNDALPTEEFVDLAYTTINTCRVSLSKAGDMMSSQGGFGAGRIGLSGRMDVPLFLLRHYFLLREMLASVELRKASKGSLQVDRRVAEANFTSQGSGTGTIVDFAKLVETLNSIWTGIKGYGLGAKPVMSVEEQPILEEETESVHSSTSNSSQQRQLEANVSRASEQFIDVVVQSVTLPLRVYMDQRSRPSRARASMSYTMSQPPLTSPGQEPKSPPPISPGPTTASPLKKIRSAVQAFEKCAETNLNEANDAMRLYLEDDRAISSLANPISERIMNTFITFVNTVETSGISLEDIPELKKTEEQKLRLAAAFSSVNKS